jgi:uncharacterized protein (TIGR00288 family)
MMDDQTAGPEPDRRIALLIDADNISHANIGLILAELSKYGTVNIRRAYGNWASPSMKGWTEKLHEFAIRPIQQFSYSAGKNATDIALVIDAMELLFTQKLDAFCIASSDADFTPLAMQLRANGHDVYGFGGRKTPEPFVNSCTTFLYVNGLGGSSVDEPPATIKGKTTADSKAKTAAKASESPATPKPLSNDTKLISILRSAVEAAARDDGWANLAHAVSLAKRQSPIDPRNYNAKNFPKLFEATKLFEIKNADGGAIYVADKRNKDRTPEPKP